MRPRNEAHHQITSALKRPRAAFGHIRFREVETDQITKLIRDLWNEGMIVRGNTVRNIVGQLYGWSFTERNYIKPNQNPCLGLPQPRKTFPKQRFLGPDEIRRLWWGVEQDGAPCERREALAFRWMLTTGLRPGGEVAEAMRNEIVF